MGECVTPLADSDWVTRFQSRTTSERVPLRGMLELTSRCNLKCVHCYLGDQEQYHAKPDSELTTDEIKALIDELVAAGTLFLTITGGDPMMRKDFVDVYRYAAEQGLLVTVYCDAILVTDKVLAAFTEYPPRRVEVSVYGATADVYEAVTRVSGSFPKALKGVDRMIDAGVRVSLKTVLMTLNAHELDAMRGLAEERGLDFRFDGAIFPCLPSSGVADPVTLRLSAEALVQAEMSQEKSRIGWVERYRRMQQKEESDALYGCQAGQTSFYVDPKGVLSPCLMTVDYRYKKRGRTFQEVWDADLGRLRDRKRTRSTCMDGEMRGACNHCPAFNYLETGDEEEESQYLRDLTRLRHRSIMEIVSESGNCDV